MPQAPARSPCLGAQLCNRFDFWNYVRSDAADYLQPDVWKVGGITEFPKIAALGASANLPISPHGAVELSVHLAAALPNALFGLNLFDLGRPGALAKRDGLLQPLDGPGHGVVFEGPALERARIRLGKAIDRIPLQRDPG
jgi:L-alanine-DL-glutamate epimerase-like enolase superfamily enzyme